MHRCLSALLPALLIGLSLSLSGCATKTARRNPDLALSQFSRLYVETRLNDNHATDATIAAELRRRGFDATHGHLTMMPEDTEVVITYDARWTWDFRSYLIELHIDAHTMRTKQVIATGHYRQPGLLPKPPETMIATLLDKMSESLP